jgi:hypothetical protein
MAPRVAARPLLARLRIPAYFFAQIARAIMATVSSLVETQ